MAEKLFVDTNIFLDLLLSRIMADDAEAFLNKSLDLGTMLTTSVSCIQTVIYMLEKEKLSLADQKKAIAWINQLISQIPTTNEMISQAIKSNFEDLEDAILFSTAVENNCTAFITQNTKDFPGNLKIPVFTPKQMISKLS